VALIGQIARVVPMRDAENIDFSGYRPLPQIGLASFSFTMFAKIGKNTQIVNQYAHQSYRCNILRFFRKRSLQTAKTDRF